jgi:hypothetical protein
MPGSTCDRCDGILNHNVGEVPFKSKIIGTLTVPGVHHLKCQKCGYYLISYEGAGTINAYLEEKETEAINSLPIGEFVSANKAAEILELTKQAFSKNKRIKRGFILSAEIDGKRLYNRRSVELFKNTNDGRFLLEPPSIEIHWAEQIQPETIYPYDKWVQQPHKPMHAIKWDNVKRRTVSPSGAAADNYNIKVRNYA